MFEIELQQNFDSSSYRYQIIISFPSGVTYLDFNASVIYMIP